MRDSQILSTFQEQVQLPVVRAPLRFLVFDACQTGVILRAVLFVEAVVGVAAMFGASGFLHWLTRLSLVTGAALPATLLWLLVACSAKRWLARLPNQMQYACGVGLGALAGLYGAGMVAIAGFSDNVFWIPSAFSGALLSGGLVAALVWRAKARAPADTAARLTELQARIRPHFLFNTLNSAIALVREDPARAEALLEDLSDLFRHALKDQGEPVTLDEEIALAQRYLAIEEVRFGSRLQLEWHLDPKAGTARLPPLLLQPLVENAVKHGVEPSAQGAQIKVSTQLRGSSVVIKVSNTVPAGQGPHGSGLALHNVRERLLLLHDVNARFETIFQSGVYLVRIEIPLGEA